MLLIGYINLVWYEWGMLRCCQLQSSPLFTNSLRSIDAGLLRGNDNINQSSRHNGPNQPEITGNVTMSYVSVAVSDAAGSPAPVRWICGEERRVRPIQLSLAPLIFLNKNTRATWRILSIYFFFFLSSPCNVSKQLSFDHLQYFLSETLPDTMSINTARSGVPCIRRAPPLLVIKMIGRDNEASPLYRSISPD